MDAITAAPTPLAQSLGLEQLVTAGGTAIVAPGIDSLLFNRAVGINPERLAEVARTFEDRGVDRYMIEVPPHAPTDPAVGAQLGANLNLERFHRPWIKLSCQPQPQPIPRADFNIRLARPADADAVAALYCAGFDVPVVAAPIIAALIGRPCWHVYVATSADRPDHPIIGIGISYLARGHVYLFGGATAPEFRKRGVQRALVAVRVNHAHRCGASSVESDTGVELPGEVNHSQHNLERAGLRAVHVRDHLVPRGTTWTRGAQR